MTQVSMEWDEERMQEIRRYVPGATWNRTENAAMLPCVHFENNGMPDVLKMDFVSLTYVCRHPACKKTGSYAELIELLKARAGE